MSTLQTPIRIGLIDGPIDRAKLPLSDDLLRVVGAPLEPCQITTSLACEHGTLVAGRLLEEAALGERATLWLYPVFSGARLTVSSGELAEAVRALLAVGVDLINISANLRQPLAQHSALRSALDAAARQGALVVVSAGDHGRVGSSALTGHPWVLPVVGCDGTGQPLHRSNFGRSIGQNGLRANGVANDGSQVRSGSSLAAPVVTGALARGLYSNSAPRSAVRAALRSLSRRAPGIIPPLLDRESLNAAFQSVNGRR